MNFGGFCNYSYHYNCQATTCTFAVLMIVGCIKNARYNNKIVVFLISILHFHTIQNIQKVEIVKESISLPVQLLKL